MSTCKGEEHLELISRYNYSQMDLRLDADTFERGVIEGTLTLLSGTIFFERDLNDSGRHPQMDGHVHQLLMSSPP
jgi:hypothetical protein